MVLYVSVGQLSSAVIILPNGTSPSFTSAWKPLQMPRMRPSRLLISSMMPSAALLLRIKEAMSFAEPSGSSPPEKPPGMNRIWDCASLSEKAFTESSMLFALRLLITSISGSAPARRIALAESNSQLVPGNTGISTWGEACLPLGLIQTFLRS